MTPLFIGGLGMQEILVIALVVLLFFGGKKIPELMKGLGKGVRSFKDTMNGFEKGGKEPLFSMIFAPKNAGFITYRLFGQIAAWTGDTYNHLYFNSKGLRNKSFWCL